MKRALIKIIFFMILLITTVSIATPTHWRQIKPGLEYTKIDLLSGFHTGHLHVFRIDLKNFDLELAIAEDQRNKIASVEDLTIANKGVVGINGGFFSQELKPLGLRITNHQLRNPLKSTSWWGVFYVIEDKPHIVSQSQFEANKKIKFAVQSGPRLIVNSKIPRSLKPGVDSRTAIGISGDNKVILVVTENLSLTTTQLAKIMNAKEMEGGLECRDALNLDGGNSTQLYAKADGLSLGVSGFSAVTDAILVIPRN